MSSTTRGIDHDDNNNDNRRPNTYVAPTLTGYSTDSSLLKQTPPSSLLSFNDNSNNTNDNNEAVALTSTTTNTNTKSSNMNDILNNNDLQMDNNIFHNIQQIPGNKFCIDCNAKEPDWGSPSFGILFCFTCSGKHRGLGVHISFVRSVRMDVWTDKQLAFMKLGGNERFIQYIQDHGNYHNEPYDANIPNYFIQKYDSPAAQLYKQVLIAEYEGKPIPTTLPPPRQQQQQSSLSRTSTTPRRKMEGFGSSPMPEQNDSSGMAKKASIAAVAVAAAAIVIWIIVPHS